MELKQKFHLPRVGLRVVKTVAAALLLTIVYGLIKRNPCFACIGAVFGMGSGLEDSKRSGGNRFFGTVVGGVVALLFFPLYHYRPLGLPGWVYLTAGLFVVLYVSQLLGVHSSIPPGSVVYYVVILTVPATSFTLYTINRIIDTGIGVALSIAISRFFPSAQEKRARLEEEISCGEAQLQEQRAMLRAMDENEETKTK